jgi:DNA-binding NarL/FixJ family response regulator
MTIGVLIVDDDELVRIGLSAIIGAQPDLSVLGEADDGSEVASSVRRLRPDVVLMDVRMPAVDGIAATRHLLATIDPAPPVLILTTFENDEYVYEALRAGASGFLLKRARPAEVIEAIRVVARGESLVFPAAIRRLAGTYAQRQLERRRESGVKASAAQLTPRESEILTLMAAGRSNAEIAVQLFLGIETIKTHVGNVLAKLGARDRTQAVIAAYETGFITPSG